MVTNLRIHVPLTRFTCSLCSESLSSPPTSTGTEIDVLYALTAIDVHEEGSDHVYQIEVDVKSIELHKVQQGRYEAYAIVEIKCPICASVHELSRKMRAPLVILEQARVCDKCHGRLTLENEILRFEDENSTSGRITVNGTLVCQKCEQESILHNAFLIDKGKMNHNHSIQLGFDDSTTKKKAGEGRLSYKDIATPIRDLVFISHSHEDKALLVKLQTSLKPLLRKYRIDIWADDQIKAGQKWKEEITAALGRAKVAVLLVSQSFLASDFIMAEEVPSILSAAERSSISIVWVPVTATPYEDTEIANFQAAHDPAKPLDSLTDSERNQALVRIARVICNAACR